MPRKSNQAGNLLNRLISSIWLFPIIISVVLLMLTGLKISGTSLSVYSWTYGEQQNKNLIANEPRSIRSDEWLVNTQMTIAQKNNNYERINKHVGNGSDMSVLIDAPYKEWSVIFKPHNLAFFVMPFDNAFAFRWWFMSYLLLMSCYFFVLTLLPGKRLFASLLATSLLFSPFIQWWYLYGTLGSLYYSLFGAIIFIKILAGDDPVKQLAWATLLTYVMTCFVLILYPPFMIPCAIAMAVFAIGYGLERFRRVPRKAIVQSLSLLIGASLIAGLISLTFLATRGPVVDIINNTAYPGKRMIVGGGYDFTKLHSGYLGGQLQSEEKAIHYKANQSDNSNFIMLAPFLVIPSIFLLYKQRKRGALKDWPLLLVNLALIVLWVHFFTPFLDPILKPLLLSKVPVARLIIGLGLLNIIQLVLFIRHTQKIDIKKYALQIRIYSGLVLLSTFCLALATHSRFPGYIGIPKALLLSTILTAIVYLVLTKRIIFGAILLLVLSIYSTYKVNPLYRGTAPLTETAISQTIKNISSESDGKWISESLQFENFPQMNGANSLSGVYPYPQLNIWKSVSPNNPKIYNRYAHVVFTLNRADSADLKTHLRLHQDDVFLVETEPCSEFLRRQNVRYILAQSPIDDSCLKLRKTVSYPAQNFYIYEIR